METRRNGLSQILNVLLKAEYGVAQKPSSVTLKVIDSEVALSIAMRNFLNAMFSSTPQLTPAPHPDGHFSERRNDARKYGLQPTAGGFVSQVAATRPADAPRRHPAGWSQGSRRVCKGAVGDYVYFYSSWVAWWKYPGESSGKTLPGCAALSGRRSPPTYEFAMHKYSGPYLQPMCISVQKCSRGKKTLCPLPRRRR
jgi:hypothetical protein